MPSGRTHDRITWWTLPLVILSAFAITRGIVPTAIVCIGFLFGGLMLGPDLDIHSVQYKRWGWFRWIWIPYRGSMRHRSPLSHSPVTGTVLRVVYLAVWVSFASLSVVTICNEIWRMGLTWDAIASFVGRSLHQYRLEVLALAVGLELGALSHYTADWGVSTYKRVKTKGWSALKPTASKRRRRSQSRSSQSRSSSKTRSAAASKRRNKS